MRSLSRFAVAAIVGLPLLAGAQTAQDLQAQAQALLNRITVLQAQLGGSATAPSGVALDSSACPLIGRSLKRGSSGDDVRRLQIFLARDPAVYPEGQATGYYGALTEAAVKRWQTKYNIVSSGSAATTGLGVVGPRTAAAIALVCSTMSGGGGSSSTGAGTVGGFIQVTPIAGNAPLSIAIQATVNTVNSCGGATYTLDYGDGTVPSQIVSPSGSCVQMTQTLGHTYIYGGTYLISLFAGTHRTSATVQVFGPGPTVIGTGTGSGGTSVSDSISASPTTGNSPLTVTFTGVINAGKSCSGGSYTIQFGDSQSAPLPFDASSCAARSFSITHQYVGGGTFTASLQNGSGSAVGSSVTITVSGPVAGSGSYAIVAVTPGVNGDPLTEGAELSVPLCTMYQIDWGDFTPVSTTQSSCTSGSTFTVSHTYAQGGNFTVSLKDGSGVAKATAAVTISQ